MDDDTQDPSTSDRFSKLKGIFGDLGSKAVGYAKDGYDAIQKAGDDAQENAIQSEADRNVKYFGMDPVSARQKAEDTHKTINSLVGGGVMGSIGAAPAMLEEGAVVAKPIAQEALTAVKPAMNAAGEAVSDTLSKVKQMFAPAGKAVVVDLGEQQASRAKPLMEAIHNPNNKLVSSSHAEYLKKLLGR